MPDDENHILASDLNPRLMGKYRMIKPHIIASDLNPMLMEKCGIVTAICLILLQ